MLETTDIHSTRQLREISISLFHYKSLLEDVRTAVVTLVRTPKPWTKTNTLGPSSGQTNVDLVDTNFVKSDFRVLGGQKNLLRVDLINCSFHESGIRIDSEADDPPQSNNVITDEAQQRQDAKHFRDHCEKLIEEIQRLQGRIEYRSKRAKDVMTLVDLCFAIQQSYGY